MNLEPFIKMKGRDMVELGKDKFLAITPAFTGDILWEHLDILQKGKKLTNKNLCRGNQILVYFCKTCNYHNFVPTTM